MVFGSRPLAIIFSFSIRSHPRIMVFPFGSRWKAWCWTSFLVNMSLKLQTTFPFQSISSMYPPMPSMPQ